MKLGLAGDVWRGVEASKLGGSFRRYGRSLRLILAAIQGGYGGQPTLQTRGQHLFTPSLVASLPSPPLIMTKLLDE